MNSILNRQEYSSNKEPHCLYRTFDDMTEASDGMFHHCYSCGKLMAVGGHCDSICGDCGYRQGKRWFVHSPYPNVNQVCKNCLKL